MAGGNFHDELKLKMDQLAYGVYQATKKFPRDEIYGLISQLRRAALSVILNYIEGYARLRNKVNKNFLEISYGSLKETKYLLFFAKRENYISADEYQRLMVLCEGIGAMLWGTLVKL